MSEAVIEPSAQSELPLGDNDYERNLLDQLLSDSRLYKTSKGFQELLNFTVRLRNMAPFNAMLVQIQKPGLNYAASAHYSSGVVASLNANVKLTLKRSYGFRTDHVRQLALYQALGKLPEPVFIHSFL